MLEKPSTSALLAVFIALIAFCYVAFLDIFLHPDNMLPYATAFIACIICGGIGTLIIAYLWEKQTKK